MAKLRHLEIGLEKLMVILMGMRKDSHLQMATGSAKLTD